MLNAPAAERLPIRMAAPGRCARWALQHGPRDHKRKQKVLFMLGAYLDAGIHDPSIRELAARTAIPESHVVTIVDWLERKNFIRVERSDARDRNQYALAMAPRTANRAPDAYENGSPSSAEHPGSIAKTNLLPQESSRQESLR